MNYDRDVGFEAFQEKDASYGASGNGTADVPATLSLAFRRLVKTAVVLNRILHRRDTAAENLRSINP